MGRLALHTFNYSWPVHRQCADAALDLRAGRHRRCGRVVRPILRHGRVQDKPFGRGIDLGMGCSWCFSALGDFFAKASSSRRLVYLGVEAGGLRAGGRSTESLADPLAPQTRSGR